MTSHFPQLIVCKKSKSCTVLAVAATSDAKSNQVILHPFLKRKKARKPASILKKMCPTVKSGTLYVFGDRNYWYPVTTSISELHRKNFCKQSNKNYSKFCHLINSGSTPITDSVLLVPSIVDNICFVCPQSVHYVFHIVQSDLYQLLQCYHKIGKRIIYVK